MANFDLKKALANQNKQGVVTNMLGVTTKIMSIPYTQLELGNYKVYDIDEEEVKDLAYSIATVGLEQNLVVKETDEPNRFVVVTGHKRTSAIKYIFDKEMVINAKVRKSIEAPMCIVIPKDEDELITRFRMHETNVHQRKGFTVSEIEDYMNTVEEAKKRNLEFNGNKIVGTTRAILKARFDISEATAKKYIKLIKDGNDEIKKAVDNGDMSINNAYDVLMGNSEPIINSNDDEKEEKSQAVKKEFTIDDLNKNFKKIEKSLDRFDKDMDKIDVPNAEVVVEKLDYLRNILNEVEELLKSDK
ncbi:ParB N-terminal domain-containing protein [[Clostridium] innocuum]|nr:ParB N-terminal domain-containing protein [[Clostridium] innocuum]